MKSEGAIMYGKQSYTAIQVSAEKKLTGDRFKSKLNIGNNIITWDAEGIAAVQFNQKHKVEALAAGGLKHFNGGGLNIVLDESVDLALWKNENGEEGIIQ